jgi:hypothetical protein
MNGGDFDQLPAITNAGAVLFAADPSLTESGNAGIAWVDDVGDPVSGMASAYGTIDGYVPQFRGTHIGNFIGNGTGLTNISVIETNVVFPVGGRAIISDDFVWKTTNAAPGQIQLSSTLHGTSRGIAIIGGVSGDVVINPGSDGGVLQLGKTGTPGNRIYLQKATYPYAASNALAFSHPLEFRAVQWIDAVTSVEKQPGIVGFTAETNSSALGSIRLYARVPVWSVANLDGNNPDTPGVEIVRAGTNGIVAANSVPFVAGYYAVSSNSLSLWPTAPRTRGDAAIVSSNGYPYILLSTNGTGGSTTWTGTNKLGW